MQNQKLQSLKLLHSGKVRDNYAVGQEHLLMVATDRLSAFDVILNQPIPQKGEILTQMSLFWFEFLKDIPNHLTGIDPLSVVTNEEQVLIKNRSVVVKKLKPLPVEAVIRGYLVGSGWKDYKNTGMVCGHQLPQNLQLAQKLDNPIYTPATKAAVGDHDENIDFSTTVDLLGLDIANQVRDLAFYVYETANKYALTKGIIIADTKLEFGLDENNQVCLMDEVLTPDSSRFWSVSDYQYGINPNSFDKQIIRDYLETITDWNKKAPAPNIPQEKIQQTREKYLEIFELLTG